MDALSRSGWIYTLCTGGSMDVLSRGGWMDA